MCLLLVCLPPGQETFADTDDGDDGERGGVGNIWDPLRIIYNSF